MKKLSQRVTVPIVILLAVGTVLYLTLRSAAVGDYMREKIVEVSRNEGIPLRVDKVSCSLFGCKAQGVSVVIPRSFVYFRLEELSLMPKPLGILLGGAQVRMTGRLYRGTFQSEMKFQREERLSSGSIMAIGLQASEIPQLSGLGVVGGTFDFAFNSIFIKQGSMGFGPSVVKISDASKPEKTTLPPLLTGASTAIEVPALQNINLQISGDMKDGKLKIQDAVLSTSLGSLRAKGQFSFLGKSSQVGLNFNGNIELNKEGMQELAGYFGLSGKNFGATGSQKFEFHLGGSTANPDFSYKPLP